MVRSVIEELRDVLKHAPTIKSGHCCNLKLEAHPYRVWICRVGDGITIEKYTQKNGWRNVAGGCMAGEDE